MSQQNTTGGGQMFFKKTGGGQAQPGAAKGGAFFEGGAANTAMVAHGCYQEKLPVAGLTVKQIREKYAQRFDIAPDARAIINGEEVSEDTVVEANAILLFSRKSGEKG